MIRLTLAGGGTSSWQGIPHTVSWQHDPSSTVNVVLVSSSLMIFAHSAFNDSSWKHCDRTGWRLAATLRRIDTRIVFIWYRLDFTRSDILWGLLYHVCNYSSKNDVSFAICNESFNPKGWKFFNLCHQKVKTALNTKVSTNQGIYTGVLTFEINQKDHEKKRVFLAGSVRGPISKKFVEGKGISHL